VLGALLLATPRAAAPLSLSSATLAAKVAVNTAKASRDTITLRGEFQPGTGAVPDPVTQAVRVTVGPFTQALSLGAFTAKIKPRKATWSLAGAKRGLTAFRITKTGATWAFKGAAAGVNLAGAANPITVGLQIGDDAGAVTLFFVAKATARKTVFTFPPRPKDDADGDGKSAAAGDCDDQDPSAFPGAPERCDGRDNDCNHQTDEGFALGGACSVGTGACRRDGVTVCAPDGQGVVCGATPGTPGVERCGNGIDDDCDGDVDEGFVVGAPCVVGTGVCRSEGLTACAPDGAATVCDAPRIPGCGVGPPVAIVDPPNLATFNRTDVTVSGTVGASAVEVRCNGVLAVRDQGFHVALTLVEGVNVVTCLARDADGNTGTTSASVTVDTRAPRVTIRDPLDGATVTASPVTVTGLVNDIVVGTVNPEEARVECNGVVATLANRSFVAPGVTLAAGANTITCVGRDRAGNTNTAEVHVTLAAPGGPALRLVSGSEQTGAAGTRLPSPLVVALEDGGAPIAGRAVLFQVQDNDGTLAAGALAGRRVAVITDASGRAQADYTLGTWSGAASSRVVAVAASIAGEVVFNETTTASAAASVVVDSGNDQNGVVGQQLARPFVAVAVDGHGNRVTGVAVTFTVVAGGGTLAGGESLAVTTDADGRAQVVPTLGPDEGVANNRVAATLGDETARAALFVASGEAGGDPVDTSVSGVVLDNTDQPVPGVALSIEGTSRSAAADDQGQFRISGVPVGRVRLIASGVTAMRPGTWPTIPFELVTVAGRDNRLPKPIYMLPLDTLHGLAVDATHGGTLTLPDVPGFALTVPPGSATFPGGTHVGTVSVTSVHPDKVPMVPSFGQQPNFVVTIQPPGVRFDPPAALTIPNADALAPGEKTEMYSFDHDLGQFVGIGPGTASEDGTVVVSDPGVGVVKGGWHSAGRPVLPGSAADCDDDNPCTVDFVTPLCSSSGKCVPGMFDCKNEPALDGTPCGVPFTRQAAASCGNDFVNIEIDRSCGGEVGACYSAVCDTGDFSSGELAASAIDAVSKICRPGCIRADLQLKMLECATRKGIRVRCDPNQEGRTCAFVKTPAGHCFFQGGCVNEIVFYPNGMAGCGGSGVPAVTLHEMVHALACEHGESNHNDGPGNLKDLVYGCEESCYPKSVNTAKKQYADAALCQEPSP